MRPKKNLMFVIPSLAGGGAERILVHLLNHLDETRYLVTVVLFEDVMTYEAGIRFPVRWIKLGKTSKWDVGRLIFRLRRTMAQIRPDSVIASLYYANILTTLAAFGVRTRPRVILWEHNDPRGYPAFYQRLIRLTYRYADVVVPVSRAIGQVLSGQFHVPPTSIKTIHNPIPLDEIAAGARDGSPVHPFFRGNGEKVILGMGRLVRAKRFDRLLEAFAGLHRLHPRARLVILGDGPLRGELEKLAVELDVQNVVSFVGFQSNPYAWIAKADLFVLSSDAEGFPMAILEAMALGTCVLATDTPSGAGESIEDRVNGRLVPRDRAALEEAMCELVQDNALRATLAARALETVRRYGIESILPRYYEIF